MASFADWLRQCGLEQYTPVFAQNDVDFAVARKLTEADLKELGLTLGHRKRFLEAVETLAAPPAPAPRTNEVIAEAERRQLTIMFCDLVGSTTLSQQLDPEALRELMKQYQQACRSVIEKYEGHVAQYLGDGLMVYFGFPRAHEDDAERAVRSALEIVAAVKKVPAPAPLCVRVGIATGPVVVGETGGGDASVPKLAVGETPNLAARLQGLATADEIVIPLSTHRLLRGTFEYQDLGQHSLKGIVQPVHAWKVLEVSPAKGRFEAAHDGSELTPFIGRESEIALLLDRWEQVNNGEGQVVLLCGEGGIGKSRTTQALRDYIAAQPHTRIRYQCSPYHTQSALYPVIEQIESVAQFRGGDSPEQKLDKLEALLKLRGQPISQVAPLFAHLLSLPAERYPPLNYSPQKQKELLLHALTEQIVGVSKDKPVLILFEDMHWVDPTTHEALDLLVPRLANTRAMLLLTYRPEYTPRWSGEAHLTTVTLNRFNARLGARLAEKVSRGKALPKEVLDQIVAKTDGVPLFVEEITKNLLESKLLKETPTRYELEGPLPPLAIPSTLHDSLMARLDRLGPVKEIAQIGAAIGREFSYELVAAISSKGERELLDALDRLVKSDLVLRRGQLPEAIYVFKHALIQDAAYQSLLRSTRQKVHQKIAEVIIERFPAQADAQPEVVAHHYTEAGIGQLAFDYWERAGRRAVARSACAEALAHFDRALEVLNTLPETPARTQQEIALQVARGFAIPPLKGWASPEGKQAFTRALALSQDTPDSSFRFGALWGLWSVHTVGTEHGTARHLAEECVALGQRARDAGLLVEAYLLLGISRFFLGDLADARTQLEACIATYDPEKHRGNAFVYGQDPKAAVELYLPPALCALGYPDRGLKRGEELLDFTRTLAHPHSLAFALCGMAWTYLWRQEWRAAQRVAEELIAKSSEQGFPFWESMGHCIAGRALVHQGACAAGTGLLQRGLAALKSMGMGNFYSVCVPWPAEAAGTMGQPREGLNQLADALSQLDQNDQRFAESELYWIKGALLEQLASPEHEVEVWYLKAIEVARRQQTRLLELRAATSLSRLWQQQGKLVEARELLSSVYRWFTEGFGTKDLKEAKALLDQLT